MAQFRATISGTRGEASRLGSKNSGIRAEVNGWGSGVTVRGNIVPAALSPEREGDEFAIYATAGSSGNREGGYIGFVDKTSTFHPGDTLRQRIIDEYLDLNRELLDSAGQVWSNKLHCFLPHSYTRAE